MLKSWDQEVHPRRKSLRSTRRRLGSFEPRPNVPLRTGSFPSSRRRDHWKQNSMWSSQLKIASTTSSWEEILHKSCGLTSYTAIGCSDGVALRFLWYPEGISTNQPSKTSKRIEIRMISNQGKIKRKKRSKVKKIMLYQRSWRRITTQSTSKKWYLTKFTSLALSARYWNQF